MISPDGKRLMYLISPEAGRSELWVSDLDGKNKVKVASSGRLATGVWSHDSRQITFVDNVEKSPRVYIAGADGSGVHEIPWNGAFLASSIWSQDDKALYLGAVTRRVLSTSEKENIDGSDLRKIAGIVRVRG